MRVRSHAGGPTDRIHIFGASGSGTSTLGRAVAARLGYAFLDADDFYWLPTDPPFREKRDVADLAPGGDMHEHHELFMSWAAQYDAGGAEVRSRRRHEEWLSRLPSSCDVLRLDTTGPVEELAEIVIERAGARRGRRG